MNQNNQLSQKTHSYTISTTTLWTALVTPFDPQGAIDFSSLKRNAQRQSDAGNGILLLGSTGEGLALTAKEQQAIVEFVTGLALEAPIMVAVGGYNLSEQLEWIAHCNSLPIAAYLLGTPIYAKPGAVGQTQWFSALLERSEHPCMLYNVPSRSGVNIPITTVKQLQNHPNCWALKEASGDLSTFLAFKQHCPEVQLFSGEDAMMPYLAGANVAGLVSVASNVWPEATHQYVSLALSGQHQGLFPLWQNAVDALFQVSSPIPTKVLMAQKSMITTPTLRAPLTEHELAANNGLVDVDQLINQWLDNQSQQIIGVK
ncbi:4-hydroxy-tetrahydrodipicolinate synthase [Thalassotalea profundi]|uniref:4-hydroxy-tetrahydrodipicolinate synthase n=1 Tax=Thalassotalea profundi TaxID=2036687 RepID=A0ABQ3IWN6_9GAMM|nr:4-hydroxy-tetrahydrodipicolinate synthase [Thalassotalea profundi]GHE93241.1 4-hydroxy-tetrahydrodipicolinate synthase [Thalassotalea profundi]